MNDLEYNYTFVFSKKYKIIKLYMYVYIYIFSYSIMDFQVEKYLLEEVSQAVVEVKKSHVCRLENQESKWCKSDQVQRRENQVAAV